MTPPLFLTVLLSLCSLVHADSQAKIIENALPSIIGIYAEAAEPTLDSPSHIGAGVIISKEGHAITNAHVIKDSRNIIVQLNDGQKHFAQVVGADIQSDLALLKIESKNKFKPIQIGNNTSVQIGSQVMAIGNPFGLSQSVTSGIVSGLHRSDTSLRIQDFIQIDAPINPGNSGGALLNERGELVGINTSIINVNKNEKSRPVNIGIGFAIPIDIAMPIINQIQKNGHVQPAWLGVVTQNIDHNISQVLGVQSDRGVIVTAVIENSPAANANIQPLDIILSVNGVKINDFEHLRSIIIAHGPDYDTQIHLIRKKQEQTLSLKTAAQKTMNQKEKINDAFQGIHVVNHQELELGQKKVSGLRVMFIDEKTPAALSGLMPNDIITHINETSLESINQFSHLYNNLPKENILTVQRGSRKMYVALNN